MFRLHMIATFLCVAFCLMLLAGAVLLNDNSNSAEMLMTAPENCTELCIMDIYPGKTTVKEAMSQLQNHKWVNDIVQNAPGNGYAEINWGWNGEQPDSIDTSKRGRATFYYWDKDPADLPLNDHTIQTATIYTHIPIHEFQDWFGETNTGNVNNRLDSKLGYIVYYNVLGGVINLTTEMNCPVTMMSYWNTTTRVTVTIGNSNDPYINPSEMIRLC